MLLLDTKGINFQKKLGLHKERNFLHEDKEKANI
jgi:hypothetical protein